jgi:AcrR family transcriptional regulator
MTPRDAQGTKERILDAAFGEFTALGFAGARVDAIADRAGVNKALLYQYYGDKEALFRHVLECKMQALAGLGHDLDRLPEVAGEFFDFHAANPWVSRLMMWEALDFGTDPVPNEAERKEKYGEHVALLREAQRTGAVDPALDPRHTLFTLMSAVVFWFAAPQAARMIYGGDPYSPEALAARRAHVVDAARRILEAR